jgi:hypothetical protein
LLFIGDQKINVVAQRDQGRYLFGYPKMSRADGLVKTVLYLSTFSATVILLSIANPCQPAKDPLARVTGEEP